MKLQALSDENENLNQTIIVIGIDWADRKHDFHGFDAQAKQFKGTFAQTPEDIDALSADSNRSSPTAHSKSASNNPKAH